MNPVLSMLHTQKNEPDMKANFLQFVKSMQGKDAQAIVQQLRASGQMSESQYQSLLQRAKSLSAILK